jgi:hypothetical protein
MDRIPDVDQVELDALIAQEMANATSAEWGDSDLTEQIDVYGFPTVNPRGVYCDRRTRAHIAYYHAEDGSFQPSRLKQYDHVAMGSPEAVAVVAMPARGRQYFLAYAPAYYGAQLVTLPWTLVSDRAPVNPAEEPMPINVPPPDVEPTPVNDELTRVRAALTLVLQAMILLNR